MSRKSVPFSAPARPAEPAAGRPVAARVFDAHSDQWVSDRNSGAQGADDTQAEARPGFVIDLAAERSLAETLTLCALAPFALTWFWLVHAMNGRARF